MAAQRYPRARWKPVISIIGTIGGLLMGLSAVVLLQQYGKLYPDTNIFIGGLIAGAVVGGVVIPSLTRFRALGRINRAIGRVEARRAAASGATVGATAATMTPAAGPPPGPAGPPPGAAGPPPGSAAGPPPKKSPRAKK
jgi:hypothetical protein